MVKEELENIIDNMYELQRKRILDIKQNNIDGVEIKDIIYLGKIREIEDEKVLEREVYLSIEEKDGKIAYKYYDEKQELIGIEQEGKPAIGKVEEINKLKKTIKTTKQTVSLKEEINKNKEKANKEKENKKAEKDDKIEVPLSQKITSKLTEKEETNLQEKIKGETLRNKLGLDPEYEKLILVSSSQVNAFLPPNERKTNVDCFIAKKANGESIVIRRRYFKI